MSSKLRRNPIGEPPDDLPTDAQAFWSAAAGIDDLLPPANCEATPALKLLGPLPFPRGGFPLLGFFATVYDHVS
ncbi:MAG: hypothetical protein ACE5E1_05550 [Phycisphaerae bacterium]